MSDPNTIIEIAKIGGPVLATVIVEEFFRWRQTVAHRETLKELNETMRVMTKAFAEERKQWSSDVREVFERFDGIHAQALEIIKSNTEVLSQFLTTIKERLPRGRSSG